MNSVDERIVKMKIDNNQLLPGVKASQNALQSLNRSVDSVGKGRGMAGLGGAVDGVKQKFSLLNAAAVTAVSTITYKLVNAGIRLVKSMTLDPIMQGFHEYETNLNSIQTIMANTGKSVGVVNKYLNDLNHYSDQTIYSFSQMADSIGKFTAAGVPLKAATSSIKGMANMAALSGSNVQQLNTAMYQMSQALSTGTIRLMDWNSLANAGMGGSNIRKALMATTRTLGDHGKAMDASIKKNGSFRDSLKTGWLTADTFNKTMKVMAGQTDKTGKTIAFTVEQLKQMGYSEDAAKQLHKLSQASIESATKIKTFSQLIDVVKESIGSGWAKIFQDIFGNFNQATKLWTGVGTTVTGAVSKFFGGIDKALVGWRKLGGFQDLWKGFGNIFKALGNIIHPFVVAIQEILPSTGKAGSGLKVLSGHFYDATVWFEKLTRGAEGLTPVFKILAEVFKIGLHVIIDIVKYFAALVPLLAPIAKGIGDLVLDISQVIVAFLKWAAIGDKIDALFNHVIEGRQKALEPIVKTVGAIISAFGELVHGDVSGFTDKFKGALTNLQPVGDFISKTFAKVQAGFDKLSESSGIVGKISSVLAAAAGKVKGFGDALSGAFDAFKGGGGKATGGTEKMADTTNKLSDGFHHLVEVLKSVGSWIKNAVSAVGSGISSIWGAVSKWFEGVDKFDLLTVFSYIFNAGIMVLIYRFVKKLGGALDKVTGLKGAMKGTFEQLTGTLKTMQSSIKYKVIEEIAISVGILVASLWLLSKIPTKDLAKGLAVITVMIGELVGAMWLLGKAGGGISLPVVASSLILMATALVVLAGAVAAFGNMKWSTLAKGFVAIAIALGILVAASVGLSYAAPSMILAAAGMVIMSVALLTLVGAILAYDKIPWGKFLDGMAKIAVALLALGVSAAIISVIAPGLLVAAVALGVLSVSLLMMLGTILAFSEVSWGTLIKGVAEIAAVLVIIGIAAAVAAPGIALLGAAVLILGAGLLMAGTGMALFAAGVTALVAVGTAAFGIIGAAIQVFLAMLPSIAIEFAAALVAFMGALAKAAPRIADSFVKIVSSMLSASNRLLPKLVHTLNIFLDLMLKSVNRNAPKFGHTFLVLLNTALNVLEKGVPRMAKAGLNIISAVLKAIASRIGGIAKTATQLMANFLNGIASRLGKVIDAGTNIAIAFIRGIGRNAVKLANAGLDAVVKVINGMSRAVDSHSGEIGRAGGRLGVSLARGVISGIGGMAGQVASSVAHMASNAISALHKKIKNPPFPSKVGIDLGYSLASGFVRGIVDGHKEASNAGAGMAQASIDAVKTTLEIASPSKVLKAIGINMTRGFVAGIVSSLNTVVQAGAKMASDAVDTVTRMTTDAALKADALAAKADALNAAASELRHKKASKAAHKRLVKEAKALERQAKRVQKQADAAQRTVDRANKAEDDARALAAADNQGKADIYNERAQSAAATAEADRQKAIKLAEEADLIRRKDAKRARELDKAAKSALASAEKAAAKAKSNAITAASWAAKAVIDSLTEVQDQLNSDKAAADLVVKLAAMTDQQKSDYYKQLAETKQAESDAKYASAQALLDKARAESATNATQAKADVAEAQKDVEAAEAAKQAADEAASSAQSALDAINQGSSGSSVDQAALTMPDMTIASSRVYEAQNMFDAYAKALSATQTAASLEKAPIEFNQYNTSPEALSPTEVYRQTNNLFSTAERKLASALP